MILTMFKTSENSFMVRVRQWLRYQMLGIRDLPVSIGAMQEKVIQALITQHTAPRPLQLVCVRIAVWVHLSIGILPL